jgi:hypothetical protein
VLALIEVSLLPILGLYLEQILAAPGANPLGFLKPRLGLKLTKAKEPFTDVVVLFTAYIIPYRNNYYIILLINPK